MCYLPSLSQVQFESSKSAWSPREGRPAGDHKHFIGLFLAKIKQKKNGEINMTTGLGSSRSSPSDKQRSKTEAKLFSQSLRASPEHHDPEMRQNSRHVRYVYKSVENE